MSQQAVINDVVKERQRQDDKWGEDRDQDNLLGSVILTEEVGEAAEQSIAVHLGDVSEIGLYEEVIQVAAVAIAWAENLHRRGKQHVKL